ncbi:MAG: DUF6617 family protein [Ferruginibacter sp.]
MEVKILDSIIHGFLKPWKLDTTNTSRFTELVKAAKAVSLNTNAALLSQLTALLADYPTEQKILTDETTIDTTLQPLLCKIDLPKYKDAVTHFYYFIITGETLRVFNAVLQQAANWTELVDIRYQVGKTLTNTRVLAKQVSIELNEQGFTGIPDAQSSFVHFALYYLKHSLIQLYFSVQEQFKASLSQVTTLEDFYLLDLEEPETNIVQLQFIEQAVTEEKGSSEYSGNQDTISFGFKDDVTKLTTVVNQLCHQIELLNEDVCNADDLIKAFTAKNLLPGAVKIQLGCETKHFRYCIDKFMPYFNNLTLANIEKSKIFYSKKDTLLKANNLSASSSKNKIEPKESANIDKIFKQLQ